jgi:trimeric autotransporter adhesin
VAASLQGPIKIPHIAAARAELFFSLPVDAQQQRDDPDRPGADAAEQTGNLAGLTNALGQPVTVYNPATARHTKQPGPREPAGAGAASALSAPNIANALQLPGAALNDTHQDVLQSRLDKNLGARTSFTAGFQFQSTRSDSVNLFGFVDTTGTLGINTNIHWSHRLQASIFLFTSLPSAACARGYRPTLKPRECFGRGGDQRQRSGPRGLGSAVAEFFERHLQG